MHLLQCEYSTHFVNFKIKMKTFNVELVLERIKKHYNLNSDKELSEYLQIKKSTLSNWRSRQTVNYELIVEKCLDMDLNVLLRGEAMPTSQTHVHEFTPSYVSESKDLKIEMLVKENEALKSRLEECREMVTRIASGQRNMTYIGVAAATPPEEE